MTSNSFHQRFAKRTWSAVQTSDLSVVWYPGLCNKCHSIHGSFSSNRADFQRERIQLTPTTVLRREKYVESNLLISFHFQLKCRFSRTIILSLSCLRKKRSIQRNTLDMHVRNSYNYPNQPNVKLLSIYLISWRTPEVWRRTDEVWVVSSTLVQTANPSSLNQ